MFKIYPQTPFRHISKRTAQWRLIQYPGHVRFFQASPLSLAKQMPPRPTIDDSEITGTYLKGSGPGGQKINKTSSAVQLIHIPTNTVVKCQATRSQSQNRKIAKRILAEKIELLEKGEQSRAAILNNVKKKRKASKMKKSKRKYRALEEEKRKKRAEAGLEGKGEICEGEADSIEEVEEAGKVNGKGSEEK
ncbi:hypothetical protein H112_08663 [Trichophyton rubrum D6]|uniref:Prokaryotic-type class I peptide chain release factors domain-containing protein n=3 Tax=Trichophyton TaxID=5550 RepID=F2SFM8_TRIRC|nr:uncharacterized protein TERG_01216 [Trichophyton rubrum CBS 118892]EZF09935.1 hypothetical protein H100_08685 [Trichophyton rubrum MR850]EZF36789.1 hypothetical protein H102_08644 [Trichophyton rubrum CBS 100081]EZF47511.1 hypothetical protein H103_08667 [Trichophyton rubrum CBS 288.86]EZF58163.1 hypothetical protein H104_08619 [Trichophyton rubrum CBS 289.86]EZF68650.1 hypothetical protein H105_08671 [Trichophyton soudanense CBS 452.61]EZF79436.1 hypothetical protein H110_08669 [Trichophy